MATVIVWSILSALGGCAGLKTQPIYNVENVRITIDSGKTPTLADVAQTIMQAAERRGWVVSDETPGHDDGTDIQRTYNKWVRLLEEDINAPLRAS